MLIGFVSIYYIFNCDVIKGTVQINILETHYGLPSCAHVWIKNIKK